MKKLKENLRDWGATLAGVVVAVATAWQAIDWSTFNLERDKFKMILIGLIAAGGVLSKFKKVEQTKNTENGKDDNNNGN